MTKSIVRSVKQTLVRLINLSLAAIIGLSSLVAATPLIFSASASAAVLPVTDTHTNIGYATVQAAIDDVTTNSGDTLVLNSDITTTTQINVTKSITIDGAGHHLYPNFVKTNTPLVNTALEIGASNVTIKNLIEDGTSSTALHGINVYQATNVVLDNVTVSHNGHSGLVVNGSNVTATSFNASNNGWDSVNVDPGSGVTLPSVFTLNSGTLSDSTQIWSDGSYVSGLATVTVNATGYTMYKIGGAATEYSWTNKSLTNAATITKNGVTNLYSTIIAAVNASQDGDTIKVAPGNYNLVKDDTTVISGQTGWYLPITKNSITLVGIDANGNEITNASNVVTNIYSTQETANGSWSTQNLITVFGNNVTIQGLGIMNKISPNKAIEVLGDNFKAVDNQFMPVPVSLFANANNYSGDDITKYGSGVYLNNNGATSARTATITNNIFKNSGVTFDSFKDNWTVDVSNNTFDGNKIWVSGGVNYYYSAIGSTTWANQPNFTGSAINIHNNNFINMVSGQAYIKIKSSMTGSYNAINNYWGAVHPDFASIVVGNVSYTPWYTNTIRTVLSNKIPVISLVGEGSQKIYQGSTYTDAGATATDNQDNSLTVVTTNLPDTSTVGTYTVRYNATDSFNNSAAEVTRTVQVLKKEVTQTVIAPTNTVSNSSPQIVIGFNAPTKSTITVPAGVTNASLDVAAILTTNSSGSKTATLSGGIDVKATTSAGQVTVALPAGTTITGAAGWDGTVNLPKIVNTTVTLPAKAGSIPTSVSSIEVGFGDVALNFSQPVRLVFAGKAGKQIGWSRSGVFSLITAVCTSDSVSGMPAGANECKIDSGADMAVWTKHFTTFTTFAQSSQYTVVAGDTLFSIGVRANVDWHLIATNNNISAPYMIFTGQVLDLPAGTVVAAAPKITVAQNNAASVLGATSSPQVGTAINTIVGKTAVATSTAKANWFNWNWFYGGASIVLLAVIYYAYIAADKKNKN